MASPAIRSRMIALLLPLLLATPSLAGDDGAHPAQRDPVGAVDVETTAALPPYPADALRAAEVDLDLLAKAVTAYRRGQPSEGDAIAASLDEPTARALLEWVAIRSATSVLPFARIDAFLKANPNYPATTLFRRRAEEMLVAERKSPAVVRAFFEGQKPVSPAGRIALALALAAEGRNAEAYALARQSWLQDHLGAPLEKIVIEAFGERLTPADHRLRAERYIFRGNDTAALRNAARVSADYVLLARARLASGKARRPIAPALISAVPAAAGHGAEDAAERIDAEWHAGFIALRFRDQPGIALEHFSEAVRHAETPISVSRAAYWQGRAFEAIGKAEEARAAYERAAEHPIAYYGQLARARLRLPDLPLRRSAAAALQHLPGHAGVRLLYRIGARDLAAQMLVDLGLRLHTTPALEALAAIAQREGDTRALLALGKSALQRGFPLDTAAFPTTGVPEFPVLGDPMERAIVHAIARQESAFDPTAVSHAGARGLMQMMPATARETARRASLPFDWPRLGRDALYSAQMGAAHLNDLLREWRGSYILTFAAYNAGSGNVKKWIEAYGDPRRPEVDAVDWIERIPFYETRNYVQRVMENLQVYRQRLNQRTAYLIDHDLKRGGRRD
ncbi:MAG: hypothetical protein B7Z40_00020 [Bosea sp. 12-68-7]|nr:MAG: hypothetical protein B7Z40_00020 [Bosea sp. 12-68-7]